MVPNDEALVTSPAISVQQGSLAGGNYVFSLVLAKDEVMISFALDRTNSLFCFRVKGLLSQELFDPDGWLPNHMVSDRVSIAIPSRSAGFVVETRKPGTPEVTGAFSKIFWEIPHEVHSLKVNWTSHPVFYSEFGGSMPAISFVSSGGSIFVGLGDTPERAATRAVAFARVGRSRMFEEAGAFMQSMESRFPEPDVRNNALMCLFHSNGISVDEDRDFIVACKSPLYYVSSGFWSRDFVLWALPVIEAADRERASELILLMLDRYWKNRGIHALYMDGRVLYDGFELDELICYLIALAKGIAGGFVERDRAREKGMTILADLSRWKHPEKELYATELNSSDDPVTYRYVTYNNSLLSRALIDFGTALGDETKNEWAVKGSKIREEILRNMIDPDLKAFCYSTDLQGKSEMYDDPTGSLLSLPDLGITERDSVIYRNTVEWITSSRNPYFRQGRYAGGSNRHVGHPWTHYFCNTVIAGIEPVAELNRIPMDNGMACETIDENSGKCLTGLHFPGASGYYVTARMHRR